MVAADDDGAVGAAPKDDRGLRAARMSSVRAKRHEQLKTRYYNLEKTDKMSWDSVVKYILIILRWRVTSC